MDTLIHGLQQKGLLTDLWRALIMIAAIFLLLFGGTALARPAKARNFLAGYASTAKLNALEAILRFIAGLAFIGGAPILKFSQFYLAFGIILAVTAVPMFFLHKQHQKFAAWAVPFAVKILPLYGMMSLIFGGFILYSLS